MPAPQFAFVAARRRSGRSVVTPNGVARIRANHAAFERAVDDVRDRHEAGRQLEAAVLAGAAANLATWMHPGLFASGELERVAIDVGRAATTATPGPSRPRSDEVRDILHVFTRTLTVGGHTRMVWRWMARDGGRRHSVAVTRQGGRPVPRDLIDGARATGGAVTALERRRGSMLDRARRLHELATQADLVVLHVDPEDAIPTIAFADRSDLPPILYLNHADHLFWLGVGISDLVVNLRHSGDRLSPLRRHVPEDRNAFLPIALDERKRTVSRTDAKERLGIPPDGIVLATVARAAKFAYRSETGETYLDAVVPIVDEFPDVRLIVVGPEQTGDFLAAHEATDGRLTALGERYDNETLLQAADVYIDSYPQMSPTSMLEAGCYATPLIALQPVVDEAEILCGDAPGIDGGLIRARSVPEFHAELRDLITDPGRREAIGTRTRDDIDRLHLGEGWIDQLEALYDRALHTPPLRTPPSWSDVPHEGPPDTLMAAANPDDVETDDVMAFHARMLPMPARLRWWWRAVRRGGRSPSLLLSEWTFVRLKYVRAALRPRT